MTDVMTEEAILHVVGIAGSLRKKSFNYALLLAARELAPPGLLIDVQGIGDLPLYNEDLEKDGPPAAWTRFRDEVRPVDGVIFLTPEYNRGVSGALKNAIDVGSRPYGSSVYAGKPAAVISQSPGALGGFGANHQLRQSLVFLDMPVLQQPEAYLIHTGQYFDDAGKLTKDDTRQLLEKLLAAFAGLIEKHVPAARRQAA
jgi:chromate reductase